MRYIEKRELVRYSYIDRQKEMYRYVEINIYVDRKTHIDELDSQIKRNRQMN